MWRRIVTCWQERPCFGLSLYSCGTKKVYIFCMTVLMCLNLVSHTLGRREGEGGGGGIGGYRFRAHDLPTPRVWCTLDFWRHSLFTPFCRWQKIWQQMGPWIVLYVDFCCAIFMRYSLTCWLHVSAFNKKLSSRRPCWSRTVAVFTMAVSMHKLCSWQLYLYTSCVHDSCIYTQWLGLWQLYLYTVTVFMTAVSI